MKKKEKRISERLYVHEMLITLESWQNFREKKRLLAKPTLAKHKGNDADTDCKNCNKFNTKFMVST